MYLIQETAKLSGVSVRTLHYYDKIGLLKPQKRDNSYRTYSQEDLDKLQTILFYKYLGFPLKQIEQLLKQPDVDRLKTLTEQRELLRQEKKRLTVLLETLDKTIAHEKGELQMTTEEKFTGFRYDGHQNYREEAMKTYGEEIILAAEEKQKGKEELMMEAFNQVFFALADLHQSGAAIDSSETQEQVDKLYHLIRQYGFDCTKEVFGHIGKGYVADERFTQNIDQFGSGTADFTSRAIEYYVNS